MKDFYQVKCSMLMYEPHLGFNCTHHVIMTNCNLNLLEFGREHVSNRDSLSCAEQHTACRLLRDSTRSVLHNATRQCTHCRWDVTLYLPVHSLSVICYYTPQYIWPHPCSCLSYSVVAAVRYDYVFEESLKKRRKKEESRNATYQGKRNNKSIGERNYRLGVKSP